MRITRRSALALIAAAATSAVTGCRSGNANGRGAVTVYTSVDQPVADPILRAFEAATGVGVNAIYDTEATKSAGLAARLLAEKGNPRADVWWGNEVFHTINLARQGVLAAYPSPGAAGIPPAFRDPQSRWAGTCLRARVIVTAPTSGQDPPPWATSVPALADPAIKGRVAIARPTAGTTGGHVAAFYALWKDDRARADALFRSLRANGVHVVGGNSEVATGVGQGVLLAGLTDNDDVESVARDGSPIAMHLPDQQPGGIGTLTIPCTVGLVAGAANPEPAKRLIDHLLSPEVEARLIAAKFGRYSVQAADASAVRTMAVTYDAVADALPWATTRALALLEGREP